MNELMTEAGATFSDAFAGAVAQTGVGRGAYRTPAGRATVARWLIGIVMAANGVVVLILGQQREILGRGYGGFTQSEWVRSVHRVDDSITLTLLLLLVSGVFFLRWLHLSYSNLRALGTKQMRFTPGWAVGYWFVPVLNIVRPAQALSDLWRATDPGADVSDGRWRSLPTSAMVTWWWGFWLSATIVNSVSRVVSMDTIAHAQTKNGILIVAHLLEIGAGACLFALIGKLTERQNACARGAA